MCLSTEYLTFIHIIVTIIVDKPEDHVHNTHENAYQLLKYDGKSKGQAQWEQPAYEGLVKGSTAKDLGEGEVYTNPTVYQQLDKSNITAENDYLAAYHPLMKQLQSKVCILIPYSSYPGLNPERGGSLFKTGTQSGAEQKSSFIFYFVKNDFWKKQLGLLIAIAPKPSEQ